MRACCSRVQPAAAPVSPDPAGNGSGVDQLAPAFVCQARWDWLCRPHSIRLTAMGKRSEANKGCISQQAVHIGMLRGHRSVASEHRASVMTHTWSLRRHRPRKTAVLLEADSLARSRGTFKGFQHKFVLKTSTRWQRWLTSSPTTPHQTGLHQDVREI